MNNTILLIDKDTLKAKWSVTGEFKWQHSPRVTDHGTIILFDNLGSDEANGRTRITEVDISTRKRIGFWEATGDEYFDAFSRGKVTLVCDRILVQSQSVEGSLSADLFYLDCPSNRVSLDCKKTTVFEADPMAVNYDNAIFLE